MNENKKAAPTVGAVGSGDRQILFGGFVPVDDYITSFQPKQGSIASVLLRGKENALTRTELSKITGMHWRKVTLSINRERKEGAPILSGTCGYWLAENQDELRRCVAKLHKRAGEIHKTARALEKQYER